MQKMNKTNKNGKSKLFYNKITHDGKCLRSKQNIFRCWFITYNIKC